MSRPLFRGAALLAVAALAGCSTIGIKPWERDILARPEMQVDHRAHDQAIDDHIYFSKEASSGGRASSARWPLPGT